MTSLPRFCGQCGTEWESQAERFCANCGRERGQPFVAPPAATSAGSAYPVAPPRPYISVATRSTWTLIFLAALAATIFASFISTIVEIGLLQRIADGEFVNQADRLANDDRQAAIAGFMIFGFVATVIAFCFWIHGASSNLGVLGADGRRFSPGWAVGWWFVPFMNLVRPYQVVKEIWQGSNPKTLAQGNANWFSAPVTMVLGWWWGIWMLSNLINNGVTRVWLNDGNDVDQLIAADYASLLGDGLTIVAAGLAFYLVRRITANQETKYLSLRNPESPGFQTG